MKRAQHLVMLGLLVGFSGCKKEGAGPDTPMDDDGSRGPASMDDGFDFEDGQEGGAMGTDIVSYGAPSGVAITKQCGKSALKSAVNDWIRDYRGLTWNSEQQTGLIYSIWVDVSDIRTGVLVAEFDERSNKVRVRFNSVDWEASGAELNAQRLLLEKYRLGELQMHAEQTAMQCSKR